KMHPTDFLVADGPGSRLLLTSIKELDASFDHPGSNWNYQRILAQNGGVIDLSALEVLTGPRSYEYFDVYATNDAAVNMAGLTLLTGSANSQFRFNCSGGSKIDLSSLATIASPARLDIAGDSSIDLAFLANISAPTTINASGTCKVPVGCLAIAAPTTFAVGAGSTLLARNVVATAATSINLTTGTSTLVFTDSVNLDAPLVFSLASGADVYFKGDLSYVYDDTAGAGEEGKFDLGKAFVYMDGTSLQGLEAGGIDIYTFDHLLSNNNFGMGQLTIGGCEQPSVVQLVDEVNNGNRQGSPEAMYLFGPDGRGAGGPGWADGLLLRNGSTLLLGDINTYCQIDGAIVHLNDDAFFGLGNDLVTFGGGFIRRGVVSVDMPENLIANGGFETGVAPPSATDPVATLPAGSSDIEGWSVDADTVDWAHEAYFSDAGENGALSISLNGEAGIAQSIATVPGDHYLVLFDLGANPYSALEPNFVPVAKVTVAAGGKTQMFCFDAREGFGLSAAPEDPEAPWVVNWQRQAFTFIAESETTTLAFSADNAAHLQYAPALDNVIVLANGLPQDTSPDPWCYSCFERGDGTGDCQITFSDVQQVITSWPPNSYHRSADYNKDGIITFSDVQVLIEHWPPNPGCEAICVPVK
ncbi:MAG: DUF642 domain-containing protein, partial [Phycisphaerae bacterium]|nr:DUF642 domain-containing protein [Phycisphaerae bacterium]